MQDDTELKRTPLHQEHVRLNARLVPFGGWLMPLQYEGILAEYEAARRGVAVFDTSHMGEFIVEGQLHDCGLDRMVTSRLSDLSPGMCRYGMILREDGGVLDDLIVYCLSEKRWMIVVNGATTAKDAGQFRSVLNRTAKFSDISFETGKLDIQGPLSYDLLSNIIQGFDKLAYFSFVEVNLLGISAIVSRTGYTGELGYEIYYPRERMQELWNRVLDLGAKPAGLGSRDVLRLEMGYSLYGHELAEDISPLEAGLERFVDWDKEFVGRASLLREKSEGGKRHLISVISVNRRSPRSGSVIFLPSGQQVGVITSGTFSPALERGIGLGLAGPGCPASGGRVLVGEGKNQLEAEISGRPFYKKGSLRT